MDSEITYQQNLVWEKVTDGLRKADAANASLESKASTLLGGSAAAVAFIVGVHAMPSSFGNLSGWDVLCLGLLCLSVIAMYCCATCAWKPWTLSIPVTSDTDKLYEEYIAKDQHTAFNNALIDAADCFKDTVEENQRKAQAVKWMFLVLQIQMLLLAVTVAVKWVTQTGF